MHSTRRNRIKNAARAQPTAIATILPVESFFLDFLGGGFGEGGFGGGAGGGKKEELQAWRGPPQRARLPAKADASNFAREFGIEPLRRLLETLKSVRPPALMLGRLPENWLFWRKRRVRRVKLLTPKGICPEKLLEERSSRISRVS